MLFNHINDVCKGILVFFLIIWVITGYTYLVNKNRDANDPKKQDYDPLAVLFAPVTTPLFLMGALVVFIIWTVLFALFIVVFTVLLIAVRKPFILRLWHSFATWIGDPLLKANTALIRLSIRPWRSAPRSV